MAEWLLQDNAMTQDSTSSRGGEGEEEGEGCGDGRDGEGAGVDCEVVTSDLDHHTVTISEDVTITSLPLTQLPPIHLQLESKSKVYARYYN